MTPKELIDAFEVLANAQDGISGLRRLVLQLAIQGRLVPQDPNEKPAEVLLQENSSRKMRLIRADQIKKPKEPPPIDVSAVPFEVPAGWEWVRLGDVAFVAMGNSPPGDSYNETEEGVPLVNGPVEFSPPHFGPTVRSKFTTSPTQMCCARDLLVCVRGATTGRTNIAAFDACIGRGVALVRAFEAQPYTNLFMWHIGQELLAAGKGTTFPSISYADLAGKPFPCPPLEEQRRIVARVDEVMSLLDKLEAAQASREATRQAMRDAVLSALRDADDPEALHEGWTRIANHMDCLFNDPSDITPLRQAVLQLAVRGRLVPQDAKEEPASKLLGRVDAEKAGLVSERKIRKQTALPPVEPGDVPFAVPPTWEWVRFGEITDSRLGKMLDKAKNAGPLRPYLRNANLQWFRFVLDDVKELRLSDEELKECSLAEGDLVICEGGEPGRCAVCDSSVQGMVYQKALHRARPYCEISPWYLAYLLRCDAWSGRIEALFTGATIKHLTGRSLAMHAVPLPPAAEQRRIVARVDELMALCDDLEARLGRARDTRAAFASSAVASFA